MHRVTKASLLSGLVFPGAGQFFLRSWMRGVAFALPSAVSLFVLSENVLSKADLVTQQILSGKLAPDLSAITHYVETQLPPDTPGLALAGPVFLLCWILSIIDAAIGGRDSQGDSHDPAP